MLVQLGHVWDRDGQEREVKERIWKVGMGWQEPLFFMLLNVIANKDICELKLNVTLFEIFKQLMLHVILEMSNTSGKITINVPELMPLLGKLIVMLTPII